MKPVFFPHYAESREGVPVEILMSWLDENDYREGWEFLHGGYRWDGSERSILKPKVIFQFSDKIHAAHFKLVWG